MNTKLLFIILGLLIVGSVILLIVKTTPPPEIPLNETETPQNMSVVAEFGDLVEIDYVLRLINGTVVDTNNPELAQQAGLKNYQKGRYKFILGQSGKVAGFDEAVAGTTLGSTDIKIIPPSKQELYIVVNTTRTENRFKPLNRKQAFTKEGFQRAFKKPPIINDVVWNFDIFPWKYRILNISEDKVLATMAVKDGEKYHLPGQHWNSTVFQAYTDIVTFYQQPRQNMTVPTDFGPARVTTSRSRIIYTYEPTLGEVYELDYKAFPMLSIPQQFQVVEIDDKTFTIKRVGLLEDQELELEITLHDLTKNVKRVKKQLTVKETPTVAAQ